MCVFTSNSYIYLKYFRSEQLDNYVSTICWCFKRVMMEKKKKKNNSSNVILQEFVSHSVRLELHCLQQELNLLIKQPNMCRADFLSKD